MTLAKTQEETPPRILLVADTWNNLAEMSQLISQAGYHADILCPAENIARHSSKGQRVDCNHAYSGLGHHRLLNATKANVNHR